MGFVKFVVRKRRQQPLLGNRARCDPCMVALLPQADAFCDGVKVPGIVFMRGGAVAILVVLFDETGTRRVLICKQPRVPCGQSAFPEIPAGMLDGEGKFSGVAAKELQEETGLVITEDEVCSNGIKPSLDPSGAVLGEQCVD